MTEDISTEEAVERLRAADGAILVTVTSDPVPTIGEVDPEDREKEIESKAYRIGNVPEPKR